MPDNITQLLDTIINDFHPKKFISFFREKNSKFRPLIEDTSYLDDEDFYNSLKLGEIPFDEVTKLVIYAFQVKNPLSERSGKKKQYEKGKRILKDEQADAGIFIFYDESGSFRFSLIHTEYFGTKRSWSNFKRFTYFVSKEQTNKTFKKQIGEGDFSSIENIKSAFSVEKVTKEFYNEIANWYFWAMKNVKFPPDAEADPNGRNIALIRLITRLIFIWFMKQKGIIKKELFEKDSVKKILTDFSPEESTYYLAILQNLFFATLNTPIEQRKFRREERYKGYLNKDYMNHSYFRHHALFREPEKMVEIFNDIPFLNGGLFECLDKRKDDESNDTGKEIRIDGFSDITEKQPKVPNFLFFTEEKEVDLNKEYGTKDKRYKVRGIINILNSYNFTIDENTPVDEEIALDPELLGRVFENLLASYIPETATTARKATGSYYTPREIVDYMVKESLKEYFKTKITGVDEEKLEKLFDYNTDLNPFDPKTTEELIKSIHNLKLLDPAVGSGAFPMGALHTLVHILHKLDPHNEKWKEEQINAINHITDPKIKQEALKKIEESFTLNELDYGRKLYLIQNCIYGVDIQPIAIQIAKLRFFISLLVDEKVDKERPNFGIEPLPNLETKFVVANTLITLEKNWKLLPEKIVGVETLFKQIFELRQEFFMTFDEKKKSHIKALDRQKRKEMEKIIKGFIDEKKQKIQDLTNELAKVPTKKEFVIIEEKGLFETTTKQVDLNDLKRQEINNKIMTMKMELSSYEKMLDSFKKISSWDPYNTNTSADWFDPEWMFGVTDGFDIVIGNPPYIQLQKNSGLLANIYKDKGFETFERTGDIYTLFYEKGINLLKQNGHLCLITSNKWMRAGYGESLRKFFTKYNPKILVDLGPGIFESATVDTNILLIQKAENQNQLRAVTLKKEANINIEKQLKEQGVTLTKLSKDAWFIGSSAEQRLKEKIERIGKPLKDWDVKIYRGVLTGLNEAFIITTEKRDEILANCSVDEASRFAGMTERDRTSAIIKPILRGRDIKRYHYEWAGLWVIFIPWHFPLHDDTSIQGASERAEKEFQKLYPAIYRHLLEFKESLSKRNKDETGIRYEWYALQRCAATYYPEFEKEKVVWQELAYGSQFAFDDKGEFFVSNTAYILTGYSLKYILGYLNSKLNLFSYEKWYCTKLGQSGTRWLNQHVIEIPLPPITHQNEPLVRQIEALVDKILSAKKQNPQSDTTALEREIDMLVYKLYDLTEEEIKIIEDGN